VSGNRHDRRAIHLVIVLVSRSAINNDVLRSLPQEIAPPLVET
jgi:hypothetical protein